MVVKTEKERPTITIEEVNRILEVGRLLLSVLTQEEMDELQALLYGEPFPFLEDSVEPEIGNTSVT